MSLETQWTARGTDILYLVLVVVIVGACLAAWVSLLAVKSTVL